MIAALLRETIPQERAKQLIEQTLHLHRDAIHIYIGVGLLLLAAIVFRRRWTAARLLLPGFVVSVLLEIADLRASYLSDGVVYWWMAAKDIVNTNLLPAAIYALLLRDKGKAVDGSDA